MVEKSATAEPVRRASGVSRRRYLVAGGASIVGALAGCLGTASPATTTTTSPPPSTKATTTTNSTTTATATTTARAGALVNPGFEDGLTGWAVGVDLPEDPNRPGELVDHRVAVSDEHASSGEFSVECYVDGVADDGTVWVSQPADLSRVSTLAVDVYSPSASFNTISKVAVYAGPRTERLGEGEFDTSQSVEDHAGWKSYEYPVRSAADGLVAVGISVVWETGVTRWLDDVRLE